MITGFTIRTGMVALHVILLIQAGFHLTGCVINQEEQVLVKETKQNDTEPIQATRDPEGHDKPLQDLEEARRAFERGDYKEAQGIYERLAREGHSKDLRQHALYALACTRMILAQDSQSFREALGLWEQWRKTAPTDNLNEDPRMMTPLLNRIPQPLQSQQEEEEIQLLREKNKVLEELYRTIDFALWEYWRQCSPTDVLLEDPLMVTPRLQNIPQLLQRQQEEIQRLRHQIEALEEIDRTIQEKKKGVTSN
jgi:hypothetical protein